VGRGPHYQGDIRAEVLRLADTTAWPPSRIFVELQDMFGSRVDILRLRTVERWVKARRGDPADQWNSADADPDEVAAVVQVLGAIMEESGGEIFTVTRDEAAWITKIRRAVPAMPTLVTWRFTKDYIAAGNETAHLDAALATARAVEHPPGGGFHLDPSRIAAHVRIHVERWPSKPLLFWAGSKEAAQTYVDEMGHHASLIKRGDMRGYLMRSHDWSWYNQDGFGRLIIDLGRGGVE
jgi:hypothetical protein